MKNAMYLFVLTLFIAGCSSDDDNGSENNLLGAWILTEVNLPLPLDLNEDGTPSTNVMDEFSCFQGSISFQGNGEYAQNLSTLVETEVNGETVITCGDPIITTGTYELEGNQLTTVDSNGISNTTTINLQQDTLSASIPFGEYGNVELVYERE